MKNLTKNLLLVVLLFGTMSMNASEIKEVKSNRNSITVLKYVNVKQGYQVTILDKYGVKLYQESIEKTGLYTKGFDLTTLPTGEYSFELDKGFEIQITPFEVLNGKVKLSENGMETVFKPVIRKDNGLVFLSHLSLNEEVQIQILNDKNNVLHSETIDAEVELRKVFDFTELPLNNYTFVIKTKDRRFVNRVRL